jgi:hypothetical protein
VQGEAKAAKQDLTVAIHERDSIQQELLRIQTSITSSPIKDGMIAIRCIRRYLTRMVTESRGLCDSGHTEFSYISDCGTLVCPKCLKQAVPEMGEVNATEQSDRICFDCCPWCRSDFWTWERLAVPYSPTWMRDVGYVADFIDKGVKSERGEG